MNHVHQTRIMVISSLFEHSMTNFQLKKSRKRKYQKWEFEFPAPVGDRLRQLVVSCSCSFSACPTLALPPIQEIGIWKKGKHGFSWFSFSLVWEESSSSVLGNLYSCSGALFSAPFLSCQTLWTHETSVRYPRFPCVLVPKYPPETRVRTQSGDMSNFGSQQSKPIPPSPLPIEH